MNFFNLWALRETGCLHIRVSNSGLSNVLLLTRLARLQECLVDCLLEGSEPPKRGRTKRVP